ncbi:hypothetical protein L1987_32112 [Smallanthus sonchifolius]|uniref:Uncharacterized protein n=1 Tax=Smallanthus sonchifolius TaxID=185202 RepID=A0ACB9I866_9ASTR|nr:hypothetical protein L1987_32112 [Smallanthus sonchifolius]
MLTTFSHLKLVLDVPKSVTELHTYANTSLEIVKLPPNPLTFLLVDGCDKLCAMEGCLKRESIKNVDRKFIRYLGLELILENGTRRSGFEKQTANTEEDSIKGSMCEDTRKTFTDHLYAALKQEGIRTFRDDDAMDRGKLLEPELKKAIRESAISIIVFSRNYASSKWCLDEALTIIEEHESLSSKHEVVPVFYGVEPSDVRNQTGSFEEAFGEYDNMIEAETDHEKKIEWLEKVKAWRVSLKKAGSLTGMVLSNGDSGEGGPLGNQKAKGVMARNLARTPPSEGSRKFTHYDTLEDTKDKDLFLHIACFFVGEYKEFIVKLLAECDLYPVVGIQNLMDRCLVYIENGRVMMHQLIKEMGQEVVRQESPKDPGKRSRLWHHQDSFNILKENGVVESLKIIYLSYSLDLIKTPDFGGLPSLESLVLEGCISLTHICESIGYLERLVLLDISGCTSLKDIPFLPRSLVSLKMCGCSNLGGVVQVPMDSFSQSSVLVDIDVSKCNLFDNSFPKDWSNLFSLKFLNISKNHITSLPGCVKTLPSLEVLNASFCPHLQSVLDVPMSLTDLRTYKNMSLEIVQLPPNPLTFLGVYLCEKLCAVEGCFKLESIKNVDRKVTRYLGLESISENGMEFGFDKQHAYIEEDSIKVSYEFGIFSTYILGKTLPCFRYKEIGSTISFRVPSHPSGSRISGLSVCFMATSNFEGSKIWKVVVNNKTKVLVWEYTPTIQVTCRKKGEFNYVWLSLWRTSNLLDDGDEIVVSNVVTRNAIVEECSMYG